MALIPVSYFNMSLACELHGIGDKIGKHLLHAPSIKRGIHVLVRIVFYELYVAVLDALCQRHANIIKLLGEIDVLRIDGDGAVGDAGGVLFRKQQLAAKTGFYFFEFTLIGNL